PSISITATFGSLRDRRTARLVAGGRRAGDSGARCTAALAVVTSAPVSRAPRGASAPEAASADRGPLLQASHELDRSPCGPQTARAAESKQEMARSRASGGRRATTRRDRKSVV